MANLRPEISVPAAIATATVVYAIQGRSLPPQIEMRANPEVGDEMVESTRKQNAWMAAATVAGISLIARDPVIFIVGGAMVVALDWMTRINNYTSPLTNKVDRGAAGDVPPAEIVTPDVGGSMNYDLMAAVN